jgi:hypothetical protein
MFCASYLWCHDCGYLPLLKCDKSKHQKHHIVYNNSEVCRMCYSIRGLIISHDYSVNRYVCRSYKKFKTNEKNEEKNKITNLDV